MTTNEVTLPAVGRTLTFDTDRTWAFEAEMGRLAEIAGRLNAAPMTFEVVEHGERREVNPYLGINVTIPTTTVVVFGETPKLEGGWTLVGVVEHAEAGNLLHGDDDRLMAYRLAGPDCDHCGLRRNRNKTVVVVAEDGRVAQVGTDCMKDFLGYHGDPERVLRYFAEAGGLDDEGAEWRGPRVPVTVPTRYAMAVAAGVVRCRGFVPKSAEFQVPTARIVGFLLFGSASRDESRWFEEEIAPSLRHDVEADEAMADELFAWIADQSGSSEYIWNLRTVLAAEWLDVKHLALAVSGFGALRRDRERDAERAVVEGRKAASEFVGTVGQRDLFTVTVDHVQWVDNGFRGSKLVVMHDGGGNTLKTFAAGAFGDVAEQGWTGTVKATVKRHEVYNGANETMVTRVAVQP